MNWQFLIVFGPALIAIAGLAVIITIQTYIGGKNNGWHRRSK